MNSTSPTSRSSKNLDLYDPFQEPENWNCHERYGERVMFDGCCRSYEGIPPHEWVAPPANDNSPNACLNEALRYASERDWFVFPADLSDGGKKSHKAAEFSKEGRRWGATKDPKQIRRDFKRWPEAIGIPTGIDIFDIETDTIAGHNIDGRANLRMLELEHGPLPRTLMAVSPSGSLHHIYKHPGRGIRVKSFTLVAGVDIKGDGGMFIAPPSVREDGAYRWLNNLPIADASDWLIELVRDDAPERNSSNSDRSDPFEQIADEMREKIPLDKLTFMLMKVIPNTVEKGRAHWIKVGHALRYERPGDDGLQLFLQFSRKWDGALDQKYADNPQLYEKSIAKTWRGLRPNRITGDSLYWLADEADPDWRDKYEAEHMQENASTSNDEHTQENASTSNDKPTSPVVMVRAADVTMRPIEWLWDGHLARGALELTTGLPGLGKSQVQIHFMACASAGLPWPDGALAIEPVNVIMVTAETPLTRKWCRGWRRRAPTLIAFIS